MDTASIDILDLWWRMNEPKVEELAKSPRLSLQYQEEYNVLLLALRGLMAKLPRSR